LVFFGFVVSYYFGVNILFYFLSYYVELVVSGLVLG